jgi:hypothetical protein
MNIKRTAFFEAAPACRRRPQPSKGLIDPCQTATRDHVAPHRRSDRAQPVKSVEMLTGLGHNHLSGAPQ